MQTPEPHLSENHWRNPRLNGRIPELDGVRGLAILLVLIEHYIRDAARIPLTRLESWALVPFRLAWSGVDLFFVLSGFLIGGILLDAKSAENFYVTFYGRRVFRIFPLYYLWLGIFLVVLTLANDFHTGPFVQTQVLRTLFNTDLPLWPYPFFAQNFAISLHGTTGAMWLGITWSLAVEEQFYLLLPLAIRNLSSKGILRLVCGAIAIAPVLRVVFLRLSTGYLPSYTLLPCRADALGYGVLIAILVRSKQAWNWIASHRGHLYSAFFVLGIGVCLLTRLPFASPLFMGLGFSMLGAFYAALLLLVIVNPGPGERLLFRWRPLMRLGKVAYAVYIFHAGISFLVHGFILGREPIVDGWTSILVTMFSLATVLLLANTSWRLMEQPLIRHAHAKFRYSFS
jgi:peptidoglycan/LPS O-acetylase OafA/YrhL